VHVDRSWDYTSAQLARFARRHNLTRLIESIRRSVLTGLEDFYPTGSLSTRLLP
jgi:transposase InsO family protein